MADLDLCYLSATDALTKFRALTLSPVELLDALIERAEAVEPAVNALAYCHFDEARAQAKKAEARYAKTDGRLRRLEGLPLAVKEDTAIKGKRQTVGSLIFENRIAQTTDPLVERLVKAGAIIHAQTTCPEFVWPWTCTSRLHGTTRNPWNRSITSGASSGGSAAAVAAGTTTLATGSDSAGSIRMPAGMCGIVGYKAPYGRNPQSPELSFDAFMHHGPMTRTLADAALMQDVTSGYHPLDHASLRQRVKLSGKGGDVKGLTIAYSIDMDAHEVSEDVRANTLAAVAILRDAGASVEEVATPWAAEIFAKAYFWGNLIYADEFSDAVMRFPHLVCDYTVGIARRNEATTPAMFHDLMTAAGRAWTEFGPLLERVDAFLAPTVATTEFPAEAPDDELCLSVNGKPKTTNDVVMTWYFDVFSRCPALAVPSGFAANGVPTGVELVARSYDDAAVFRVAGELERQMPLYHSAQTRPAL